MIDNLRRKLSIERGSNILRLPSKSMKRPEDNYYYYCYCYTILYNENPKRNGFED